MREFDGAAGGFAEPEGNGRRRALGIDHTDRALDDAPNLPGRIPEQKDVASDALDGEVLVDGADEGVVGFGEDAVVAELGDGAAVLQGGEPGRPATAYDAVDAVKVDEGRGASAAVADAGGEHVDDLEVGLAGQRSEGRGAAEQVKQVIQGPVLAGGLGHDLLGEHVEGGDELDDAVEFAGADGAHEGGALDQFIAGGREEAALGAEAEGVARAPDALQEDRDAARRADLADQVDAADVDTEFERSRGHQRFELAVLELLFHVQATFAREAAVVAGDAFLAETVAQVVGDALGQGAGVYEHQRGVVLDDEIGEAVVDVVPLLAGGDGFEVGGGRLNREIQIPLVTEVNGDAGAGIPLFVGAGEERGQLLDGSLSCRQADALGAAAADVVEAFEREGEVAAAAIAGQGVNLVDDDGVHAAQRFARPLGREHQVEGLRRGDEDVRRAGDEGSPARGLSVAGADADADLGERLAARLGQFADGGQGGLEIAFDVVAEGLERRDVDDARDRIESLFLAATDELVDPDQEGGKGLAGSGWGRDEGVAPGADGRPGGGLGVGWRFERRAEPAGHEGMKRRGGGVGRGEVQFRLGHRATL